MTLLRRVFPGRTAEWVCWTLAAALLFPQLAGMTARAAFDGSLPDGSFSDSRRTAFDRLMARGGLPTPSGYLELPAQQLKLPVFDGTGEAALTLGAGHLSDTSPLNGAGNAAIAGHRDGFFRKLQHVSVGDLVVVHTTDGARTYRITETWIVSPDDVWVLDQTTQPALTLITCHPFYFVGNAPDRFVVRAELIPERGTTPAVAAPSTHEDATRPLKPT